MPISVSLLIFVKLHLSISTLLQHARFSPGGPICLVDSVSYHIQFPASNMIGELRACPPSL